MKKFVLLALLALFSASLSTSAFAATHHHHHQKHHKTHNGTPNHKPA